MSLPGTCDLTPDCTLTMHHQYLCSDLLDSFVPFAKDLWNQIVPNLFLGGSQEPTDREFDAVLTLWHNAPTVYADVEQYQWFIQDGGMPPLAQLDEAVGWVKWQWTMGRRVLVRCRAGLNRSGLVVGRVLIDSGRTPEETIHMIRQRRSPYALCNANFEQYLRSYVHE